MKNIIGVGVLLQTPSGTYLFQERDNNTKLHPNKIAAFGGGIENNEDVYQCAMREMLEELSLHLDATDLNEVGIFEAGNTPKTYIQMFLVKEIDPLSLQLQEGRGIIELSLEDALRHEKVTDWTKAVLNSFSNPTKVGPS